MTNRFDDIQEAAKRRAFGFTASETLARQIVTAAQGDARIAYDYLDALNKHVTNLLQGKKQ
jgi:hypothetical protein